MPSLTNRLLARFPLVLRFAVLLACGSVGVAWALPSCPTLIYEGASPATGGLIDPGRPTITFKFNRNIAAITITGGVVFVPGQYPWSGPVRREIPRTAWLFDDISSLQVPVDITVSGNTVTLRPQTPLNPNRPYHALLQGIASPIKGEFPDGLSSAVCPQPSIKYNITAQYYTRPTATGGCLAQPTTVTRNRYGLTPGCRYNMSYESYQVSSEDEEIQDASWIWGNAVWSVRGYTAYPISEQRGVKVEMKNITWNGAYWVAETATAKVTGSANTPQSIPEGSIIQTYNNVVVAFRDNMLLLENYVLRWDGGKQDLVPDGGIRGWNMTLSPGI